MFSTRIVPRFQPYAVALIALAFCASSLKADMIELTNGDHYRGKVVAMDSNNIEFISEIQGRVHLPRNKVAQITFHDVIARPIAQTNAAPVSAAPLILSGPSVAVVPAPAVVTPAASPSGAASAEDVVAQMRKEGVQPQLINQVQEQIFGKASPEASAKFEELMNGLMSGKISVQDLRVQAQTAIQQARDAKKDLGNDAGDMLDSYIGILEKFVAESAPSATPAPVSTPAPVTTGPGITATFQSK